MVLPNSKRTLPEDQLDKRYRGMALPFVKKPLGYFQSMFSRDVIKSSIFMILSTNIGERVCVPEFGSRILRLVFEPNDIVTRNLLRQIVVDDVTRWEPRVTVRDVRVASSDHEIKVYVEYIINGTQVGDSAILSFSQRTQTVSLAES